MLPDTKLHNVQEELKVSSLTYGEFLALTAIVHCIRDDLEDVKADINQIRQNQQAYLTNANHVMASVHRNTEELIQTARETTTRSVANVPYMTLLIAVSTAVLVVKHQFFM